MPDKKVIDTHNHIFSIYEIAIWEIIYLVFNAFRTCIETEKGFLEEERKEKFFDKVKRIGNIILLFFKTPDCIYKSIKKMYAEKFKNEENIEEEDIAILVANMMDIEYGWPIKSVVNPEKSIDTDEDFYESFYEINTMITEYIQGRENIIKDIDYYCKKEKNNKTRQKYEDTKKTFKKETAKLLHKAKNDLDFFPYKSSIDETNFDDEIIQQINSLIKTLKKIKKENINESLKLINQHVNSIEKIIKDIQDADYPLFNPTTDTVIYFEDLFDELKVRVRKYQYLKNKPNKFNEFKDYLDKYLDDLELYYEKISESHYELYNTVLVEKSKKPKMKMKDSVTKQIESLTRLKSKFEKGIYSFLAIDPRRKDLSGVEVNLASYIKKEIGEKQDIHKRPFLGIKIYPPQGYLPSHPNLQKIYSLCTEKKANGSLKYHIPIIAHCGINGFTTVRSNLKFKGFIAEETIKKFQVDHLFDPKLTKETDFKICGEKRKYFYVDQIIKRKDLRITKNDKDLPFKVHQMITGLYADPLNWVPVFEGWDSSGKPSYPNHQELRIDLAHFGGDDEFARYIQNRKKNITTFQRNWTETIIYLIRRYPEVYSDISTISKLELIEDFKKYIIEAPDYQDIKKFLLYGSDIWITLFHTNPAFHLRYYDDIGYDEILYDNPRKFLFNQ